MSPGNELIDKKELDEIKKIFTKSNGVLFAHGSDKRRKIYLEFAILRKNCLKNLIVNTFNVLALVQPQLK